MAVIPYTVALNSRYMAYALTGVIGSGFVAQARCAYVLNQKNKDLELALRNQTERLKQDNQILKVASDRYYEKCQRYSAKYGELEEYKEDNSSSGYVRTLTYLGLISILALTGVKITAISSRTISL